MGSVISMIFFLEIYRTIKSTLHNFLKFLPLADKFYLPYNFTNYRVIHKSLRDFRPLRYNNRDGDAEGEHVNRGRDTPIFCATLQVLDMSTLGDAANVKFGNFGRF
jgi:hypothetical protein